MDKMQSIINEDELDPITLERRRMVQRQITAAAAQIEQANKNMIRKFPAFLFKRDFLDWLRGAPVTDPHLRQKAWIEIAGDCFSPVDLTDEQGKVVIRVPGLHNKERFSPSKNIDDEKSTGDMTDLAMRMGRIMPNQVPNMVEDVLIDKFKNMIDKSGDSEEINRWLSLYKYFNTGLYEPNKNKQSNAKKNISEDGDELDIEY